MTEKLVYQDIPNFGKCEEGFFYSTYFSSDQIVFLVRGKYVFDISQPIILLKK